MALQEGDDPDRGDPEHGEPEPLPTSLVPRWLAWLVLIALGSSAAFSVWSIFRSAP